MKYYNELNILDVYRTKVNFRRGGGIRIIEGKIFRNETERYLLVSFECSLTRGDEHNQLHKIVFENKFNHFMADTPGYLTLIQTPSTNPSVEEYLMGLGKGGFKSEMSPNLVSIRRHVQRTEYW